MRTIFVLLIVLFLVSTLNITTSDAQDSSVYMYWTDDWACKIQRANLSGSNVEDLVPQVCPARIAVDIDRGKMYWTESALFSKIQRANLDGSNVEDLVTYDRNTAPELSGIALDVAQDKMYWVDGQKIRRANLNGTDIEDLVLLPEGRGHWADIALDTTRGKLYWADGDKIYRVNLDGSNIQEIHDLWTTNSIAVDVVGGKIYYSDGSNIRYSDLDGSNREFIFISGSRGTSVGDMALDVAGGKIYWVGAAHHVGEGILSVNLDGTNMQLLVTTESEEVRAPNSIALSIPQTTETPVASNKASVFTEGSSATRAIAENTQSGINIGSPVAATDADNDTLTYTLSGTDANAFSLDTTTGQLRTRAALDHETQSVYTVIITASDGKLTDSITVTINITDIDEPELVTTPSTSDDTDNAQDSTQWHLPEGASARLGKGTIGEIAYSPDGGHLAVASGIGIWIYDAFTGAEVALFRGHTGSVLSVAYSRDGRTLATTSSDNTVRLWDAATGTLKNTLTGGVYSVAYSPDGSTLATGGYRDARLWDATTGTLKNTLEHTNSATKVIFSPDGSTLATRGFNGTVRLWDTITGTLKNTLEHTTFVDSVAYSPDGATLATGGSNEIYLWDATSGTLKSTLEAAGWIYSIAYSPDGSMLAANGYSISSVEFRPEVHLWDTATGTLVRKLTGQRGSFGIITYSRDGRTLASASRDVVYLWDAATGALIQKLTGHTGSVYGTAYHPNERTLASAHYNGLLHLWDATTGNFINTHADGGNLYNIAYSPNGRTVAGGGYERVYLWDADNGNLIHTLEGHTSDVDSIAYSPDGNTIATGSKGEVRLWDAATGTLTNTLEHPGSVKSLAYSPDGATLATGSDDRTARLWDAATGTLTNTLTGHTNWVNSVAYSPGGSTLATGSGREVRLWDAATGTLTHTLIGPHDVVYSLAYSPDGRTLASGNYNGAVRLWDMTTHTLLQTLMGHTGVVYSVAYSPDGTILATGSDDGTVLLWDVAPTVDAYPAWDVNEDGQTNITDLILVLATFEKTPIVNPRTDVNGDGTVDKQDIIIVARHLGESTTPAAPISVALPERLTPETLQQALDLLRTHNDGSLAFQRGIARLEQLLALLIPKETALLANYPNPFNPETWIPYELAEPADVSVRIYSVNGSLVRRLSLGHQAAGMYRSRSRSAYWDGKNELGESVASGVYFYTLTAGDFTATRKMLIRK